jgi:hypothetical protein
MREQVPDRDRDSGTSRRRALGVLGTLLSGGGILAGLTRSGAFTTASTARDTQVSVAQDSDAIVPIVSDSQCSTVEFGNGFATPLTITLSSDSSDFDVGTDGTIESDPEFTVNPGSPTTVGLAADTDTRSAVVDIEGTHENGAVSLTRTFDVTSRNLEIDPATATVASTHTWEYLDLDYGMPGNDGDEIDEITVEYPNKTAFDGLNEEDITVTMRRTLDDGKDTSEISVNNGDYSGKTATFDLSGNFQTDAAGLMRIVIKRVENPPDPGCYKPTITFIGDASENEKRTEGLRVDDG